MRRLLPFGVFWWPSKLALRRGGDGKEKRAGAIEVLSLRPHSYFLLPVVLRVLQSLAHCLQTGLQFRNDSLLPLLTRGEILRTIRSCQSVCPSSLQPSQYSTTSSIIPRYGLICQGVTGRPRSPTETALPSQRWGPWAPPRSSFGCSCAWNRAPATGGVTTGLAASRAPSLLHCRRREDPLPFASLAFSPLFRRN
jgi:hypothetical protein